MAGEEAREAYRTFAIHSCDTESGYRRDESWETEVFDFDDYTQQQYDALLEEFRRVEAAPEEMAVNCSNEALMRELSPWLDEFGKLGVRLLIDELFAFFVHTWNEQVRTFAESCCVSVGHA